MSDNAHYEPLEFEDDSTYTGPGISAGLIEQAEKSLGVKLPASYLALLRTRNGGVLRRRCYPTPFTTSWAPDHFEITAILGIGGEWGIAPPSPMSSPVVIEEWGYPDIGVVVCLTPSAGHDTVMLDYSGDDAEPAVVYVDEVLVPRRIAASFAEFLANLVDCEGLQPG